MSLVGDVLKLLNLAAHILRSEQRLPGSISRSNWDADRDRLWPRCRRSRC
jgi:hypothetical protein